MIDSFTSNGAPSQPAALHAWNESYLQRHTLPEFSSATEVVGNFDATTAPKTVTSQEDLEPITPISTPGPQRDRELADCVSRVICGMGYAVLRKVQVQAHRGQITLSGRVPLYYFKQLAQASLRGIPGVDYVRNDLDVG